MLSRPNLIVLLLILILTGCAAVPAEMAKPSPEARTFVFSCNNGPGFVAREEGQVTTLFLPTGTQRLKSRGNGVFEKDGISIRIDGEAALLKIAEESYQCRNNRREATWEHAKLNGADFRAIGNEPGWNLEIHRQAKLILVTDYGSNRYEFDLPAAETDTEKRTARYRIKHESQDVTINISGQVCSDSMSGEKFESSVTVDFDGRILRGCGKALH